MHHCIKYFTFIYCLSLSPPLQFQSMTAQNKSMPALSRPLALQAIIYIHLCISSILFITQKNTALHKLQEFISLSIHFDCCILFIWILIPSYQFTIHSFHAILLSLSCFLLTPRNKFLLKFSQTLLQSCLSASVFHSFTYLLYLFSPSLISRYYLTYIHHTTLRVTWTPCLTHPIYTLKNISSIP